MPRGNALKCICCAPGAGLGVGSRDATAGTDAAHSCATAGAGACGEIRSMCRAQLQVIPDGILFKRSHYCMRYCLA